MAIVWMDWNSRLNELEWPFSNLISHQAQSNIAISPIKYLFSLDQSIQPNLSLSSTNPSSRPSSSSPTTPLHLWIPPMVPPDPIENPRTKEPNLYPAPHSPQPAIRTPILKSLTQPPYHQLNRPLPTRLRQPQLNRPHANSTQPLLTQPVPHQFNHPTFNSTCPY